MPNTKINHSKLIKILKEDYFPQERSINVALFGNANCICLREIKGESFNKLKSGSDDVQLHNWQTINLVSDDIHAVCFDIKHSSLLVALLTNSFNCPIWIFPRRVLQVDKIISECSYSKLIHDRKLINYKSYNLCMFVRKDIIR